MFSACGMNVKKFWHEAFCGWVPLEVLEKNRILLRSFLTQCAERTPVAHRALDASSKKLSRSSREKRLYDTSPPVKLPTVKQ